VDTVRFSKGDLMLTQSDMRVWRVAERVESGYHVENPSNTSDSKFVPFGDTVVKIAIIS
jgi:hypothetical protein